MHASCPPTRHAGAACFRVVTGHVGHRRSDAGSASLACIVIGVVGLGNYAGAQQWPSYGTLLDGNVLPDTEVAMLSHSDKLFPVNIVFRKGPVRSLPVAPQKLGNVHFQSGGREYDLFDYITSNRVAGLLVLKDGKIAFEDYELGTGPKTHWASFSMAKSVSCTLLAVALKQGLIKSLDEPVTRYVPALKGGVYDDVSIRNILQMASGVKWNETYTDPNSDQRRVAALRVEQKPGRFWPI